MRLMRRILFELVSSSKVRVRLNGFILKNIRLKKFVFKNICLELIFLEKLSDNYTIKLFAPSPNYLPNYIK